MPTPTSTATATAAPTTPGPVAQPGGAGDEKPARYRTRLRIGPDGIGPAQVAVRGSFALEFVIRNDTARGRRVTFAGKSVRVPAHMTATLRHRGVRPGRRVLRAGNAGRVEVLAAPPGEP